MFQLVEETAWHEVDENTRLESDGKNYGERQADGLGGDGEGDRGA